MTDAKNDKGFTSLLFEVWTLAHNVGAYLDQTLAESGLSADDFAFYSVIYAKHEMGEDVTPNAISEIAGLPATTVSSYLSRLIARGHIIKTRNPVDGRSALITLTPAGVKAFLAAAEKFAPAEAAVVTGLPAPADQAFAMLAQLSAAVQAASTRD